MATWYLPEILRQVHAYADLPSFVTLCQASRSLHAVGHSLLYESITLDLIRKKPRSLSLLGRSFEENPELALCVKHLRLQLCYDSSRYPPEALPPLDIPHLLVVSNILKSCANIQTISIAHPYPTVNRAIREFRESLSWVRQLRELDFNVRDARWPPHVPGVSDVNILLFIEALKLNSIKTITLTMQEGPESPLPTMISLPTGSRITRLSFQKAYLSMESLDKVLCVLPHLKHLSLSFLWYADSANAQVGPHLDCEKLGQALEHCSSTLESLVIAVRFECRMSIDLWSGSGEGSSWGLLHRLGSLRSYTKLASLELCPEVLLGWDMTEPIQIPDLLPDSLQHLCLRWEFGMWENSPWMKEPPLDLLLNYLDNSRSSALETLTVMYLKGAEDGIKTPLDLVKLKCRNSGIDFHLKPVQLF